jgi:hypothetical protein
MVAQLDDFRRKATRIVDRYKLVAVTLKNLRRGTSIFFNSSV